MSTVLFLLALLFLQADEPRAEGSPTATPAQSIAAHAGVAAPESQAPNSAIAPVAPARPKADDLLLPLNGQAPSVDTSFFKKIAARLSVINQQYAPEKVYLQFDRLYFEPGDDIWFNAYVRDANSLKASTKSEVLYVELLGPNGSVLRKISLLAKGGVAAGDFKLEAIAPGGQYKVRAYTNWMRNTDESFERSLQVQATVLPRLRMELDFLRKAYGPGDLVEAKLDLNTLANQPLANHGFTARASLDGQQFVQLAGNTDGQGHALVKFSLPAKLETNDGLLNLLIDYNGQVESISRSVPIVLNKIDLQWMPEGGDLVAGLPATVAFKALNEWGKPADVAGKIVDSKGVEVASFKSYHMGMGGFFFTPAAGEAYHAVLTKPEGIAESYGLPEAFPRGFSLKIDPLQKDTLTVEVNSTEDEALHLALVSRGDLWFSQTLHPVAGSHLVKIPVKNMPIGIAQVTLFDSRELPRAERLVFLNHDKQLKISVKTNKEKYLPREKVTMTVQVTDERGIPMPGQYSLAVADDNLLTFADDRQGHLLSHLLLESDLKGKVEEPNFYFEPKEKHPEKNELLALDYLMLTQGWRRMAWEEILAGQPVAMAFEGETYDPALAAMDLESLAVAEAKETDMEDAIVPTSAAVVATGKGNAQRQDFAKKQKAKPDSPGAMSRVDRARPAGAIALVEKDNTTTGRILDAEKIKALPTRSVNAMASVAAGAASAAGDDVIRTRSNRSSRDIFFEDGIIVREELMAQDQKVEEEEPARKPAKKPADLPALSRKPAPNQYSAAYIYVPRQFYAPKYTGPAAPEAGLRNDFRKTVFFAPLLEVGRNGKATVEFYNTDAISTFRATVEGIGTDGSLGRCEQRFFTQMPFSMDVKVPVNLLTGDRMAFPLTLTNNTDQPLKGKLDLAMPAGFVSISTLPSLTLKPGETTTIYPEYEVGYAAKSGEMRVGFEANGQSDAFVQGLKVQPRGFPVDLVYGGNQQEKTFSVPVSDVVEGSLQASFTVHPSVMSDLTTGMERMIQQPSGCFEQTSSTNYPNLLVLNLLKSTGNANPALERQTNSHLDFGYHRLLTFEVSGGGFDWFSSPPAHEALSAYGLMEFVDMKAVYPVDQALIDRTATWLLSRRDGKGGWLSSKQGLHSWQQPNPVSNAYITWAMTEAGYGKQVSAELASLLNDARKEQDPYIVALAAKSLLNMGDRRASEMLEILAKAQADDGSWMGKTASMTQSTGANLKVETTALATLAFLANGTAAEGGASPAESAITEKAVRYLAGAKTQYGFGSTQGTVLALKALVAHAEHFKKSMGGEVALYVNGQVVAKKPFTADERNPLVFQDLEKYFTQSKNEVRVKFTGDPLPYDLTVRYATKRPLSHPDCKLALNTSLGGGKADAAKVGGGETIRLSTTLTNRSAEAVSNPVAVVGIPAGLSVQPWQLKEMSERKRFDFYEIKDGYVVFYFRSMEAGETKQLHLDLKADIPGEYEAPASAAWLYYANDAVVWSKPERVGVSKS